MVDRKPNRKPGLGYRGDRHSKPVASTPLEPYFNPDQFDIDAYEHDVGPTAIKSTDFNPPEAAKEVLLHHLKDMEARSNTFAPMPECGHNPSTRPLDLYLKYGAINLDKPPNPSSHEVVAWIKRLIPHIDKVGHSGTLDPKVTGCLIVCLGNATRLVKAQQKSGKTYVCAARLHNKFPGGDKEVQDALNELKGPCFQRPPVISAVKRQLRIRTIFEATLIELNNSRNVVNFIIRCEAGTYLRTFCIHLGYILGVGAHMQELRRIASGNKNEDDRMFHMHDLRMACDNYVRTRDERDLRTVVFPLEELLVPFKRILIKDTAVSAICHGAKLSATGILRFDSGIRANAEVVIVSTKGEAVAIAIAVMNSDFYSTNTHGVVAKVKRVIMDRNMYTKKWGNGPYSAMKRQLKEKGELDQYGKFTDKITEETKKLLEVSSIEENQHKLDADGLPNGPWQPNSMAHFRSERPMIQYPAPRQATAPWVLPPQPSPWWPNAYYGYNDGAQQVQGSAQPAYAGVQHAYGAAYGSNQQPYAGASQSYAPTQPAYTPTQPAYTPTQQASAPTQQSYGANPSGYGENRSNFP